MTQKSVSRERTKNWNSKLKAGTVQMLARVSAEFDTVWNHYRQTIPRDQIEKANLPDLDWSSYYRDVTADQTALEVLLDPDRFVEVAQEALKVLAEDRTELFMHVCAWNYAVLLFINGLDHPADLLKRIREGDDEALFDFAKVDKTIIAHRYVDRRIRIAQISGDSEFFRKLGNALRWDPRNRPAKVHKRNFLLKIIALCATEHLTMNEVCEILETVCGVYEEDVETIRKAWVRAGFHKIVSQQKNAENRGG